MNEYRVVVTYVVAVKALSEAGARGAAVDFIEDGACDDENDSIELVDVGAEATLVEP